MKRTIKNDKILKRIHQQIVKDNASNLMMNHIKYKIENIIWQIYSYKIATPEDIFDVGCIFGKIYMKRFPEDISAKRLREYYIKVTKIQDKYGRRHR